MNDHISKPIQPSLLVSTVTRYYRPTHTSAATPALPVAVPAPAATEALPLVEGLDTTDGMLRVGGNRTLYLKLLRQFIEAEHDAPARIRERLSVEDRATAERMAHTIKGVAGSLGAGAVQAAAAELERAVKEGSSAAGALCDNLATMLSPLVAGLRVALGEPPSVKASENQAAIDPAMIRETVVRMTRFLSEFDPAAVECLGSDGARFRALFDPATLSEFEQHVAGYAFTEAQALLDRAARDRGI
jgi:HPt (histidine-containing phosphotransfer) domain-containing protein